MINDATCIDNNGDYVNTFTPNGDGQNDVLILPQFPNARSGTLTSKYLTDGEHQSLARQIMIIIGMGKTTMVRNYLAELIIMC